MWSRGLQGVPYTLSQPLCARTASRLLQPTTRPPTHRPPHHQQLERAAQLLEDGVLQVRHKLLRLGGEVAGGGHHGQPLVLQAELAAPQLPRLLAGALAQPGALPLRCPVHLALQNSPRGGSVSRLRATCAKAWCKQAGTQLHIAKEMRVRDSDQRREPGR